MRIGKIVLRIIGIQGYLEYNSVFPLLLIMFIEGRNTVIETFRAKQPVKVVYIEDGINKDGKISKILSLARKAKVRIKFKPKRYLDKVSKTFSHQGVIAVREDQGSYNFQDYVEANLDELFLVYIREAQYEFNLGAVIRTSECAGATGVVISPKTEISPQTVRASMGASEHLPILQESLFNAIKTCKKMGVKVVGIEVSGDKYYYQQDLTGPMMLIIGGEDRSLSKEIIAKCDFVVKIPLRGKVNSLNMSVAAGIVIYDKIRQESVKQ